MKKVAIYGTGNVGKAFYQSHDFKDENVIAFIETKPTKSEFLGINVIGIQDVGKDIDKIYIANSYVETVYKCIDKGIPKNKLIFENKCVALDYANDVGKLDIEYDFAIQYEIQVVKPKYVITDFMRKNENI